MWYAIIFIGALLLRIVYLLQMKSADPLFFNPQMDALYHHEWAMTILKGGTLGTDAFFRAPLYPYFLALLYKIFGVSFVIPRIIQSIIGSLSCVVAAQIGTMLFKKKVGIIAGIIAALYPILIYFDNELLLEGLLTFFVLLGCFMVLKQSEKGTSKSGWYVTGLIWGLAAITRPNVLLFLVVLPFWMAKKLGKHFKAALLFGILGTATAILPVTIRNYVVSKEFVLIAWQAGTNFYIGNNPQSDGYTAIVPGTRKSWWGGFQDAKRLAEEATGRQLKNSEIDRYWITQGLTFVKDEPFEALFLLLKKAYLFFGGYELANNRDKYFFAQLSYLKFLLFNAPLVQFPFGLFAALAVLGTFIFIKRTGNNKMAGYLILLFIACYAVSFIVFFVCARFRLPVIPFVLIFATFGVFSTIESVQTYGAKALRFPLFIFIAYYIFLNANVFNVRQSNPSLNYLTLGLGYQNAGRIQDALNAYDKAIQLDPMYADAYYFTGNIYAAQKQFAEAQKYYLKAIEVDPTSSEAYNNLGNIYLQAGDYERALACYMTSIKLQPSFDTPLYHAGLIYKMHGDSAKAESLWERALRINPQNIVVRRALEHLRQR